MSHTTAIPTATMQSNHDDQLLYEAYLVHPYIICRIIMTMIAEELSYHRLTMAGDGNPGSSLIEVMVAPLHVRSVMASCTNAPAGNCMASPYSAKRSRLQSLNQCR